MLLAKIWLGKFALLLGPDRPPPRAAGDGNAKALLVAANVARHANRDS